MEEISLSVPILLDDRVVAGLTVRFCVLCRPFESRRRTLSAQAAPKRRPDQHLYSELHPQPQLSGGVASTPLKTGA